jgi:hypothetical protein
MTRGFLVSGQLNTLLKRLPKRDKPICDQPLTIAPATAESRDVLGIEDHRMKTSANHLF